jgi:Zn-finger nucleic acid-binding protein
MTGMPVDHCPSCGGQWIDGRIAVPIVGSLRFTYRLGTTEVATEVAARMCGECGAVQLRARDPEAIVRAERAAAHVRPAKPRSLRSQKGQAG